MKLSNMLFIVIGFITFGAGIIGIFIPVLPTTPFLLLTSFCFAKGSPRFHNWFCSTNTYEKYLATFVSERKMTLKNKLCILLPATFMLSIVFLFSTSLHIRLFLVLICVIKYIYFFTRIDTVKKNDC